MRAGDSSPFDASHSPRMFWQGRDSASPYHRNSENQAPYDPDATFSPSKRRSLENLKCVSRVRNSPIFRDSPHEYDPTQVYVPQRPLAGRSPHGQEKILSESQTGYGHAASQVGPRPPSPSKDQVSPAKSSLSKASRFGPKGGAFDPGSEIWSDIDAQRQAKSVTFDAAPPQVNEYEMTTPDPSSIASESRDGSYDSENDEGDVSFDRGSSMDRDDSFDASLEDTEKTPVVMPEDWRYMSPSNANDQLVREDEDPFTEEGSQSPGPCSPTARMTPVQHPRVESLDSNGERRPLPPLPSSPGRPVSSTQPSSPGKLASAFELAGSRQRNLPTPPGPASYSKSDLSETNRAPMSLEDRLRLMMVHDDSQEADSEEHTSPKQPNHDSSDEQDAKPVLPKYMHYDPDCPMPSIENDDDDVDDDTNSVIIKEEEVDEDIYDIPEYYEQASKDSSLRDLHNQVDDDGSQYSRDSNEYAQPDTASDDSQSTPVPEVGTAGKAVEDASHEVHTEREHEMDAPKAAATDEYAQRPVTPPGKEEQMSEPSTPDSVIRHPVDGESSSEEEPIPDPVATVKAHGSGLKTRPSFTPADMQTMAATRRKVSGQAPPPMPLGNPDDSNQFQQSAEDGTSEEATGSSNQLAPPPQLAHDTSKRLPSLVKLDVPFSIQEESLGFGLDKEFDRVIESQKVAFESSLSRSPYISYQPVTQPMGPPSIPHPGNSKATSPRHFGTSADPASSTQRGYLMRQNTKVIVASSRNEDGSAAPNGEPVPDLRGTRSAGSSPRKPSQQTWTTVPWNGQMRRPSVKRHSNVPKKKPVPGPVPPLPGHQSNVQDSAAAIEENEPALNEALEDGEERGRCFVKVVGMKYLDLPLPRGKFVQSRIESVTVDSSSR